jgi:hypothetical protein
MVKVDMAAASSRAALQQPVLRYHRPIDKSCNINGAASSSLQVRDGFVRPRELELKMSDRKWLGDIGLAVLLALPTGALTRPQITGSTDRPSHATASAAQTAFAEHSPLLHRFSLPG